MRKRIIGIFFMCIVTLLGCNRDIMIQELLIKHQGVNRSVTIEMLNDDYLAQKSPFLIILHGRNENADLMRYRIKNKRMFLEKGIKIVYPNGSGMILKNWNDLEKEMSFLNALIDTLSQASNAERRKIFVAGFSQGGQLAYKLVCAHTQKIDAIAMIASQIDARYIHEHCKGAIVPLISINSEVDPACPIDSFTHKGKWFNSVEAGILAYVNHAGDIRREKTDTLSQYVTMKKWWDIDCNPVVQYITKDGGHGWPKGNGIFYIPHFEPSKNLDASQIILEFFIYDCIKTE